MDRKVSALSTYRFNKAKEDLETARIALNHKKYSQSVNRSYYAIFHSIRALLAFERFDSKRHSAIISRFNQSYIATGEIDKEYYKFLASVFDLRNKSDYQDFYEVSQSDAISQLTCATKFLNMIEQYIRLKK
jgi:uncharacterized protein (UPF0332 family)